MSLSVIILAAGQGTRMASKKPKVLQTMAGKPLLSYMLDIVKYLCTTQLIVVIGHKSDLIKEAFPQQDITWVYQAFQKGTGHAVQLAFKHVQPGCRQVLILPGDMPLLQVDSLKLLLDHKNQNIVRVLSADVQNPQGLGRIIRGDIGQLLEIIEDKDATEQQKKICEVNTGVICLPYPQAQRWLTKLSPNNQQKELYLTDVVKIAQQSGVACYVEQTISSEEGIGINDKKQLNLAELVWQKRQAQKLMALGTTICDPMRLYIRGVVTCGQDVLIESNVVLEGKLEIADDCYIGFGCLLKNVCLGPGCRIEAYSILEDCKLEAGCQVGPFARLRPQTQLAQGVKIGNFVETKAVQIGSYTKVNHLSYLGNATIGSRTNIGAGTITCNYDGVHKYQTIIEDDVFIGSDTQLVAPLTIGQGATIAAGSTIRRSVEAQSLGFNRKTQDKKQNWIRPGTVNKKSK